MSSSVPHFVINLDQPPDLRWDKVVAAFAPAWPLLIDKMWKQLSGVCDEGDEDGDEDIQETEEEKAEREEFVAALCGNVMQGLKASGCGGYVDELVAAAHTGKVDVNDLVMLNLGYESACGCTSIIAHDPSGVPMLGRTMDWLDSQELVDLTIDLTFVRGGKCVFKATSWAGYFGVLTGMRNNGYAVAINFRESEPSNPPSTPPSNNPSFSWPIGYLVRRVLEREGGYDGCVHAMATTPLMAPCYVMICGLKRGEGCQLTRSEQGDVRRLCLEGGGEGEGSEEATRDGRDGEIVKSKSNGDDGSNNNRVTAGSTKTEKEAYSKKKGGKKKRKKSFFASLKGALHAKVRKPDKNLRKCLVQANLDHWQRSKKKDVQESIPRIRQATTFLKARNRTLDSDNMWQLLTAFPIWSPTDTIYATVMCARTGAYHTITTWPPEAL